MPPPAPISAAAKTVSATVHLKNTFIHLTLIGGHTEDVIMFIGGVALAAEVAVAMFFLAFLVAVLIGLWRNSIETRGMLRNSIDGQLALHRAQLLTVTLVFATCYGLAALALGPGKAMPDVPTPLLGVLLGSHATYLAGKRHHFRRLRQSGR